MKPPRPPLALPLLAAWAAFSGAEATAVSPIQKVLQMLQEMHDKGVEEQKAEAVRFSSFNQFCGDTSAARSKAIEDATEKIGKLSADIGKAEADIDAAADKTAELEEDMGRWKKDSKAAADVREKERFDYEATRSELADAVDACERAAARLLSEPKKLPQAELVQVRDFAKTPAFARSALASFLGEATVAVPEAPLDAESQVNPMLFNEAPQAYAYESQSGGVVKILQDLRQEFKKEITSLDKEELGARHACDDVLQRLVGQTDLAAQERNQQAKHHAERSAQLAVYQGEKAMTEDAKKADEAYLQDLAGLCKQKSSDFENRQQLREEELQAITKAVEIISSKDVAVERLPGGAAAASAASSFAQVPPRRLRSPQLQKVAALLRERAQKSKSDVLALLAKRAEEDPFSKVKSMIRDMITKLLEQAASESDHKAWCDAEMSSNKLTRDIKTREVDEISAEIDRLAAAEAELTQEIADLSDNVASITKAMQEAVAERQAEKETNEETIADAFASQKAIAEALAVLREFYAKAAQATSFAQRQSPAEDAPETFGDEPYTGMQGESGGVLGMLEVIVSDFARLEAETSTAESEAVADHKRFMADSDTDKAVALTEIEHNDSRLLMTKQSLSGAQTTLEQTRISLDAATSYYYKLKPSCEVSFSYDERVQKRKEEIESLRDAYVILAGEELPSVQEMKAEQIGA
eukprot:CAMPEP_0183396556 /NCGR_PEP_ID=MMETSP0370-20130417/10072_1 /TAXON_ID=268820 /ORGANISM="Peridinium aciculiferum, Strain PAER-2" /LENGTH=698 /DNA_ID=CAMNT_0025577357 /DNA_START=42 /DNA_END=2138 /DNA_ORIENTATION=+